MALPYDGWSNETPLEAKLFRGVVLIRFMV